jgi:hypothetical protein
MPSRKIKRSIMSSSVAALPTSDEIASRAHELFIADGRRLSTLATHWERAEQELLDRAFKKLSSTMPAGRTPR